MGRPNCGQRRALNSGRVERWFERWGMRKGGEWCDVGYKYLGLKAAVGRMVVDGRVQWLEGRANA